MSKQEITALLQHYPLWQLDEERLRRVFRFERFPDSVQFVNQIAELAEEAHHHPNIAIENKRLVRVDLWTHKMDCITVRDAALADRLEQLFQTATGAVHVE
ncbi:4a-hydroxytetrahydrobiopterin dehydratase [Lentzea sp. NPDC051208]|uniref:4a-hydroxytetrahydrobiopterin dehydratase n=1 Tax=Lentzea sp. NPDC051208 TaxID=3154642 RepID=UPI00342A513D